MNAEPARRIFEVAAQHSKAGVLEAFAQALDLPSYFGHNLDALADSLHDFADGLNEPSTLIWNVAPEFKASKAYRSVLSMVHEAENAQLKVVVRQA
ncbi:barstar family protein [Psychromicrobium sp. YIM B11713]|uniref:barstar family protein n=1 Tax=Psychromicrobium sp. YIM B11713 TaxID=3145233 RepID=UPI00374E9B34